jgi:hypothetical protein
MKKPKTAAEFWERQRDYMRRSADGHIELNRAMNAAFADVAAKRRGESAVIDKA